MGITAKAREEIRSGRYVPASQAGAILGISPWATAGDAWCSILGLDEKAMTHAMLRGTYAEEGILRWFADTTEKKIRRNVKRVDPVGNVIRADLDAMVIDQDEAVEAKTSSKRNDWGEPGSDEIPDYHWPQIASQLIAAPEVETVWVPVHFYDWGEPFELYQVTRDSQIPGALDAVRDKLMAFHRDHIATQIPPSEPPSSRILSALDLDEKPFVELPPDILARYELAKEEAGRAKADFEKADQKFRAIEKEVKGHLFHAGAHEGRIPGERKIFTFYQHERRSRSAPPKKERPNFQEIGEGCCELCGTTEKVTKVRTLRTKNMAV